MNSAESSRAERARSIFQQVLDSPASGSADLLSSLCGDDPDLESEVRRLLTAREHAAAQGFMEDTLPTIDRLPEPAGSYRPEESRDRPSRPPIEVPHYELLHRIGEGQFAEVWLARHDWLGHLSAIRLFERVSAGEIGSLRTYKRVAANHPHLTPIEEVGLIGDWVYCVMP